MIQMQDVFFQNRLVVLGVRGRFDERVVFEDFEYIGLHAAADLVILLAHVEAKFDETIASVHRVDESGLFDVAQRPPEQRERKSLQLSVDFPGAIATDDERRCV
jgi:hypothetical protein